MINENAVSGADKNGDAIIDIEALLAGRRRIRIRHNGELYQLQITAKGKLILTK